VPTPTERFVEIDDVRLRVTEAGTPGDPVVILAHGFPELAYSWRHQIPVLAAAGYHVLAPDQRGYGGSSGAGPRRPHPKKTNKRAQRWFLLLN
jgi:pimeloyl-ACP methyl ester carboxylesterase